MRLAKFLWFFLIVLSSCSDEQQEAMPVTASTFEGNLVGVARFGGSSSDRAASIVNMENGQLTILGTTESIGGMVADKSRSGEDFWLFEIDENANLLSSKTYGGSGGDVATDLITTKDGGFLMSGYSMSSDGDASKNEGFHDSWFVKTNTSGGIEWEKSYGFAGHDHSYSIVETVDGGYFSAGFLDVSASGGAGSDNVKHGVGEFWGQKLDASGDFQWRNYFGGSNNDRSHKALQTSDGGFMLIGFTESNDFDISQTHGSYDFWVVKLTATGSMEWERSYGGIGIDIAHDAILLDNGDCIIVGQSNSADGDVNGAQGDFDGWVIRIDAEGYLVWQKSFGASNFEFAQAITPGPDDSFFIVGNTRSADLTQTSNAGENDIWAFQIDGAGKLLWQQSWGGAGIDLGIDAVYSENQSLYILGTSQSESFQTAPGLGSDDILLLQIN